MTSVKIYKILQKHAGIINNLAVLLADEKITKQEAKALAIEAADKLTEDLSED